jgi:GT2 family glycosyltransferase
VPTISAVIPASNAPPTLTACLAAIRDADAPPDETIVVDDEALVGPAAARNQGARRATGEILVFVDADVCVHPDAFARNRAAFETEPGLTALFGSYDDRPSAPGVVSRFRNLLHHHVHQSSPGPATTFWGGIGAIRREAFLQSGGFDERRFRVPSIEDVDLGMRLAEGGARIELRPEIQGTHLKAWGFTQMLHTDFSRRGVPWVRLLLESRSSSTALNLGWRHRLSSLAVVAAAASLVARRTLPAAAAGATFVALNRPFYRLLFRRLGTARGVAGVGLHAVHHAVGIAAAAVGLVLHTTSSRRGGHARPPDADG